MQYIEYVKLGIAGLSLLIDLIKDIKASHDGSTSDSDAVVDKGISFLGELGNTANIKELKGIDLSSFAPDIKQLVSKLAELKNLNQPSA